MPCSGKGMRAKLLAAITLAARHLRLGGGPCPLPAPVHARRGRLRARRARCEADLRPGAGGAGPGAEKGEKPARWISRPVEAPHEFDLVGLAGELRHVEIRVRDEDGWTEWVEQEDATPIYVDGAEAAQVRAPFRPSGQLHFVNVSGTAGGLGERLLHSARGAINSAFITIASAPPVHAAAPKPPIVSRAAWGADLPGGCQPRGPAEYGSVSAAVVHHTVNANTYTPEEAAGIVLGICRFHVNGNGWNDIGYNALVDRYGVLYEGRAGGLEYPVVGAHAQGYNSQTTAIASIGDHRSEAPTPEAVDSIVRYLAWKLKLSVAVPASGTTQLTSGGGSLNKYPSGTVVTMPRIIGHLDLGLTACPGLLEAQLPAIRAAVDRLLGSRAPCCKPCRQCKRSGKRKSCEHCRKCKRKQKSKRAKLKGLRLGRPGRSPPAHPSPRSAPHRRPGRRPPRGSGRSAWRWRSRA